MIDRADSYPTPTKTGGQKRGKGMGGLRLDFVDRCGKIAPKQAQKSPPLTERAIVWVWGTILAPEILPVALRSMHKQSHTQSVGGAASILKDVCKRHMFNEQSPQGGLAGICARYSAV